MNRQYGWWLNNNILNIWEVQWSIYDNLWPSFSRDANFENGIARVVVWAVVVSVTDHDPSSTLLRGLCCVMGAQLLLILLNFLMLLIWITFLSILLVYSFSFFLCWVERAQLLVLLMLNRIIFPSNLSVDSFGFFSFAKIWLMLLRPFFLMFVLFEIWLEFRMIFSVVFFMNWRLMERLLFGLMLQGLQFNSKMRKISDYTKLLILMVWYLKLPFPIRIFIPFFFKVVLRFIFTFSFLMNSLCTSKLLTSKSRPMNFTLFCLVVTLTISELMMSSSMIFPLLTHFFLTSRMLANSCMILGCFFLKFRMVTYSCMIFGDFFLASSLLSGSCLTSRWLIHSCWHDRLLNHWWLLRSGSWGWKVKSCLLSLALGWSWLNTEYSNVFCIQGGKNQGEDDQVEFDFHLN